MAEVETPTTESQTTETPDAPRDMASILYPPKVEPEEEATEEETSTESQTDESPQQTSEVEEGEQVTTVAQLIEHQEWDPEWFNSLKVPIKVNGESSETTIAELVKSHQIGEAASQRLNEAKAKAQTLIQEATQKRDEVSTRISEAAALVQLAEKLFDLDAKEANLASLRETDQVAYLAEKDRLAELRGAIEGVKRAGADVFTKALGQVRQADGKPDPETVQREASALLDAIPAWKVDREKAAAEATEMVKYLGAEPYGWTPEQVGSVTDHKLHLLAYKAMLYDKHVAASVETTKKRVLTIPKVMKPGAGSKPDSAKPKDAVQILYGTK